MFDFHTLSLTSNLILFIAGAVSVWIAGTHLSKYADQFAKKAGIGDVIVGTLLLGGITSLPEIVTTITASTLGQANIAVNNLFGGVALQVTILVAGDWVLGKRSLTSYIKSPVVQLQGFIGILLLSVAACLIIITDVPVLHIGIGSVIILMMFVSGFYFVNYLQTINWWKSELTKRDKTIANEPNKQKEETDEITDTRSDTIGTSRKKLLVYLSMNAVIILIAGYVVVLSGDAIAKKTLLNENIVGALLIAVATSLPELSTTISSVRLKAYRLAFSNIFGTNIFTVGFVFISDVFYRDGPVLNAVDEFSLFGAILGIFLTSIYLIGLSIRFKSTIMNIGYDSLLVLFSYIVGMLIMFYM